MNNEFRICQRCVMDSTDPLIYFDEKGICNHCTAYYDRITKEIPDDETRGIVFQQVVDKIKSIGKGNDYDCVIGLSGGVDSSYLALKVKDAGLKPLAVHLDNGWNSELAVDNIKRIVTKLDIDLITHVIDWDEFRDLQKSFIKASVPNCEIPTDHAINALLFNTASKFGIKYIIGGGNIATEGILPISWTYYNQDLRHIKAIHAKFGSIPIKTTPTLSLKKYIWLVMVKGIRIILLLNYMDYNKDNAKKELETKLGWRDYGGKHYESIYTRFYQGFLLPNKFGIDKRKAHFSTLICSGQMTREEAIEELATDSYKSLRLEEDMSYIQKKLGFSETEFNNIMKSPIANHTDYPSSVKFLEGLKKYRGFFKRIATKA